MSRAKLRLANADRNEHVLWPRVTRWGGPVVFRLTDAHAAAAAVVAAGRKAHLH